MIQLILGVSDKNDTCNNTSDTCIRRSITSYSTKATNVYITITTIRRKLILCNASVAYLFFFIYVLAPLFCGVVTGVVSCLVIIFFEEDRA